MTDSETEFSSQGEARQSLALMALIVAVIMWGLAVALPVWDVRTDESGVWNVFPGWFPALMGFLGIFFLCPAWYANLLAIPIGVAMFKGRRAGFAMSAVAFAIAASAYILPGIYSDNGEMVIMKRRIGFYLWLGSFLVIMLAQAAQASRMEGSSPRLRWVTIAILVLGVIGLEFRFRVGVSPLETALKDPNDLTAFTVVLAGHPSQAEKDAAVPWAMLQDLREARSRSQPRRIEQLVSAGANVNQSDHYGTTPLMKAVETKGAESIVAFLVRAGANVNARDHRGKATLDVAEESDSSPECRQILVDGGALATTKPTKGR